VSLIVIALAATLIQDPPPPVLAPQDPPVAETSQDPAYRVEDIVVEGRRVDRAARAFIAEVARPPNDRGPARWAGSVCVGAANFSPAVAQYLVDHVSDVAESLGVRAEEPGCDPSILIVGAADGAAMADHLVSEKPQVFWPGGAGMNYSRSSLRDFRTGDRAVRWWHVSAPVISDTGELAVRLPGMSSADDSPTGFAPWIVSTSASRLREQVEDQMKRSIIVVDVDMLEGVGLDQLGDYIAFVALAQVDPDVELTRFESVLNLFSDRPTTGRFSPWDEAYLSGLYSMRPGYVSRGAQIDALGRSIVEAYLPQTED